MTWGRLILVISFLALLLMPATALAADTTGGSGLLVRVNGTTTVRPGEEFGSVIVIDGDAVINGTVRDTLWVISGTATINGRVNGDVMVVNGALHLKSGAVVKNVSLVSSDMQRDPGTSITGTLNQRSEFISFGWGSAIFSFIFWLGATIVVLLAGLAFAALGGSQLMASGMTLTERFGASIVTALVLAIGLPIVATIAFVTVIGIPLALAIILVVIPALWLLGYLVAGTRLGAILVSRLRRPAGDRPYLAAVLGLLVFQLVGLVPVIGGLIVALAGLVGAGALAYRVYANRVRRGTMPAIRHEPSPGD